MDSCTILLILLCKHETNKHPAISNYPSMILISLFPCLHSTSQTYYHCLTTLLAWLWIICLISIRSWWYKGYSLEGSLFVLEKTLLFDILYWRRHAELCYWNSESLTHELLWWQIIIPSTTTVRNSLSIVHQVPEGHVGVYWRGGALLKTITEPGMHLFS